MCQCKCAVGTLDNQLPLHTSTLPSVTIGLPIEKKGMKWLGLVHLISHKTSFSCDKGENVLEP